MTSASSKAIKEGKAKTVAQMVQEQEPVSVTGTKFDNGKPRFDLLSPIALGWLSVVLTDGAINYDPHDWRKGIAADRLNAAILRHAMPMLVGDYWDRKSGRPHAAHLMAEAMFFLELQMSDDFVAPSHIYNEQQKDLLAALLAGKL